MLSSQNISAETSNAKTVGVRRSSRTRLAWHRLESRTLTPIRTSRSDWILGFPAGVVDDFIARVIGPKLSERLGQNIVVDNRAGAAGTSLPTWWHTRLPTVTHS
jgi:hypothetical protein